VDIGYADDRLERACTKQKVGRQTYGEQVGKGLEKRIAQMRAADSVADLLQGLGKWHWLNGDLDGCLAGSITANWRLVVEPLDVKGKDATAVRVRVIAITDYH
jgi:toxin HigB-1